jgi:putative nucleotidyltransferase with HDIG domain
MAHTYLGLRRDISDQTRSGVRDDVPEIELIHDIGLRDKVVDAWSYALCCSEFERISDLPPEGNPGSPALHRGSQLDHLRGVVRLSLKMAEEFETWWPETTVDHDVLVAGAICHDVGKPYEFDSHNRLRWSSDPSVSGQPAFRHSVYGVHVCLTAGLPEEIAHIALGHSMEGQFMGLSTECVIIRHADHAWWQVAGALGLAVPGSLGKNHALSRPRQLAVAA